MIFPQYTYVRTFDSPSSSRSLEIPLEQENILNYPAIFSFNKRLRME